MSTDHTPAVQIATGAPVTIVDSVITNLSGGPLVGTSRSIPTHLTLDRVTITGGTGKVLDVEYFASITVRNCTINRTNGMKIAHPLPGASVLVTRNKQRNLQGPSMGATHLADFVELAYVQTPTAYVSWNEIINEFGKSEAEDVIDLYKSSHVKVHNNYIQGGYPLANVAKTSANGITVEAHDYVGGTSSNNEIWNNQVVDHVGGIAIVAGFNNYVHHNRVVQDGKLADGSRLLAAHTGMWVWDIGKDPTWANNRARYNVIGHVNAAGRRNDMWFPDASGDVRFNQRLRGKVTVVTEQNERKLWKAKLAARKIKVGA